jgi:beta-glucanase (GH16 family)
MDLKGYKLIFEDDFNGKELDLTKWELAGDGCADMAQVGDGLLKIKGSGSCILKVKQRFLRGYFEIRCICNDPVFGSLRSIFKLLGENCYSAESNGGTATAEIDIVEGRRTPEGYPAALMTIRCSGYHDGSASESIRLQYPIHKLIDDVYTQFHTYGLDWNEECYRFYIDGEPVAVSTWGDGPATTPEELIVALEPFADLPEAAQPEGEFVVDYVRVYQKQTPTEKRKIDLTGYRLVFEDDFDGESLDLEKWDSFCPGKYGVGFHSHSAVSQENGNLVIEYKYREGELGEGWYTDMIRTRETFCRGYFEIRCVCNDPLESGFWSAFFLMSQKPYEPSVSQGGIGGAEIDIIEAFRTKEGFPSILSTVHCGGYRGGFRSVGLRTQNFVQRIIPDCYTAFHTYGLEWTEDEYRIYVDGELIGMTSWSDGVLNIPVPVILCIEMGDAPKDKNLTGRFILDYVRIYQKD